MAGLWWLMLWISTAVTVVVLGLIGWAIVRGGRRGPEVDRSVPRWGDPFIVIAGVVVPVVLLTSVFVVSVRTTNAIDRDPGPGAPTIEVVGHLWWWEVRYGGEAVTANEIHIPTGVPVRLELTSVDVLHSFWVPELAPKVDMIPGRTNVLTLRTDRAGTYRGQCAEFCGLQHANMAFTVVAQPPDEFERWLASQVGPAEPAGEAEQGLEVFLGSACGACHAIRGTPAQGTLGPDLTHLASRDTLAAGTIENTPGNLADWISDPQSIKPGAVMPPTELDADELAALVDYLSRLA